MFVCLFGSFCLSHQLQKLPDHFFGRLFSVLSNLARPKSATSPESSFECVSYAGARLWAWLAWDFQFISTNGSPVCHFVVRCFLRSVCMQKQFCPHLLAPPTQMKRQFKNHQMSFRGENHFSPFPSSQNLKPFFSSFNFFFRLDFVRKLKASRRETNGCSQTSRTETTAAVASILQTDPISYCRSRSSDALLSENVLNHTQFRFLTRANLCQPRLAPSCKFEKKKIEKLILEPRQPDSLPALPSTLQQIYGEGSL